MADGRRFGNRRLCRRDVDDVVLDPQAIKILRSRDARSISLITQTTFVIGCFLWLLYGVLIGSASIILFNIVTVALNLLIIGLKLRFDRARTIVALNANEPGWSRKFVRCRIGDGQGHKTAQWNGVPGGSWRNASRGGFDDRSRRRGLPAAYRRLKSSRPRREPSNRALRRWPAKCGCNHARPGDRGRRFGKCREWHSRRGRKSNAASANYDTFSSDALFAGWSVRRLRGRHITGSG